jgi:outer membrane protein TolC
LEDATRDLQAAEDEVKLTIRDQLRGLLSSREGLQTQVEAVTIAQRRVRSTDILLDAGRVEIRDVLEAQTDLVNAQDDFTRSLINYRIAELQLQRDLGLLRVNHEGQWEEYSPEALRRLAAAGPATRPTAPAPLPGVRE